MSQVWQDEWQSLLQVRDAAIERAQRAQAEISAAFRRRQPPTMSMLRAAADAEAELSAIKLRLKAFLGTLSQPNA